MKKQIGIPLIFLSVLFLFGVEIVLACKCKPSISPCATFQRADAVFIGTAKEIKDIANLNKREIRFRVEESFKGTSSDEETIVNSGLCDFHFQVGKT